MRRMRVALAALVVLGLCAAPVHAQYFGQNKVQYRRYAWRWIESDHFQVYFHGGLDSLALRVLDLAEKTGEFLARRTGHRLGHRVPIILYGSHNDFSQTNVIPELIEQGTGGFTELFHNRVVLPFTGSYEELRHVVVHELSHAFMFDMLYGGSATQLISRRSFYSVPLWFAEGLAEYLSLGMEPNAEMFLRDGIVQGYLPPLAVSSGYLVYKQGQSALSYLVGRYGEERLRELLRRVQRTRNFERAFQRVVGLPVEKFDEQWREWLRREYWPTIATKRDPGQFARQLTDHLHDGSALNTAPAISPQGDRIAYFSDRRQYTDVYVMSAYDGKVLRRVIRGERNVQFEAIPSFRSSITWSPDGRRLALTAKGGGHDLLYVVSVESGRVLRRFELPCDALAYPAWSPVSDTLVVVGVTGGRSDLWLVNAGTGEVRRLTDDAWDEKEPCWTPDGRLVTFSSDRLAPVVLEPERTPDGFGRHGLFDLELETGAVTRRLSTAGDDRWPAWSPDGRKLAFITDRGGTPNIVLYDTGTRSFTQLTDVLGGVSSLSWSRQDDRLVFSAFRRGGYDVFAVREPVSVDAVLARLRREMPQAVASETGVRSSPPDTVRAVPLRGALAVTWPESLLAGPASRAWHDSTAARDTLGGLAGPRHPREGPGAGEGERLQPLTLESTEASRERSSFAVYGDTVPVLPTRAPLRERGGAFALSDSLLAQHPRPYHVRFATDYVGAGILAATGLGFAGNAAFVFGDFLGDQQLHLAADLFGGSLDETNVLAVYSYLPRRWDFSVGLFHFKNYYSSRVTTTGEALTSPRLFSEGSVGGLVGVSRPFDRFRRLDLTYTQMFVQRTFYDSGDLRDLPSTGRRYESVSSPAASLVGDHALWGPTGPVNGGRYNLTYSPSLAWFPNGLAYHTLTFDARRYWDLTRGYTFAGRLIAGRSDGPDAQTFFVGGFSTLRGFPAYDIAGTRVAIVNAELRFPFIERFGIVGPVPLGSLDLRGVLFGDMGLVWRRGEVLRFTRVAGGVRRLASPLLGFGMGARTSIAFMVLKLDAAWRTDLAGVGRPRWEFSIGPEF
jgi:Tol biopolymer transport system component